MPNDDLHEFLDNLIEEVRELAGDPDEAYAENIARNLTESVRQPRNKLHGAVTGRKTLADVIADTEMDLQPSHQRNLEASVTTHLKELQRRLADEFGRRLKAMTFMGLSPDEQQELVVFKLDEHAKGNHPNLGSHPFDNTLSVPVPPELEKALEYAKPMANMTEQQRNDEFFRLMDQAAQKKK